MDRACPSVTLIVTPQGNFVCEDGWGTFPVGWTADEFLSRFPHGTIWEQRYA